MPLPFGRQGDGKPIDVDQAVRKIKTVYAKYADAYGSKIFNLGAFEDRYRDALARRLDLTAFLAAEITAVEELKKRVEEARARGPKRYEYSEKADRIIERNLERISKYRPIDFHPDAELETRRLAGAAADWYENAWRRVSRVLKSLRSKQLADFVDRIERDFAYYVVPSRGSYSRAVEDYSLVLVRKNPRENERAAVSFIRFGAVLLNNCLRAMGEGLDILSSNPRTGGDSKNELADARVELARVIEDFRLQDIREY